LIATNEKFLQVFIFFNST